MLIYTVGRGKNRRVKSFGFGSINKQLSEMMRISRYVKQRARYMVDVAHVAFNLAPIPRDEKEEA